MEKIFTDHNSHKMKVNLKFTNLKKTYNNESKPALYIPDEIKIYSGQITAILGYSASGKSTLLNQLALIDSPDINSDIKIRVESNFVSADSLKEKELNLIRKQYYGFIFQSGHLLSHFNVKSNIALPLYLNRHANNSIDQRTNELIHQASFSESTGLQYPNTLSGGQYIRAATMRGLSHDPTILFADEPTGNLDPIHGKKIIETIINGWMQTNFYEKSFLMVTHDYQYAYNYADRIIVLASGELVMDIKKEENDHFVGRPIFKNFNQPDIKDNSINIATPQELLKSVEKFSELVNKQHSTKFELSTKKEKKYNKNKLLLPSTFLKTQKNDSNLLLFFTFKYALNELYYNLKMSVMNISTLSILIFSALVIGGVLLGAEQMINKQIDKDPLMKRIILYASSSNLAGDFSDRIIEEEHVHQIMSIKSEFGRLKFQTPKKNKNGVFVWPKGDVVDKAIPWSDASIRFYTSQNNLTAPLPGRTVSREDPLLNFIEYTKDGYRKELYEHTFFSYDDNKKIGYPFGIIVSKSIIENVLKYPSNNYPNNIFILFSGGRKVPLELVGIATNIPDGSFLITDKFYKAFLEKSWVPRPLFREVHTGPYSEATIFSSKNNVEKYVQRKKRTYPFLSYRLSERLKPGEYWFTFTLNTNDRFKLWTKSEFENKFLNGFKYQFPNATDLPNIIFGDKVYKSGVIKNGNQKNTKSIYLTLGVYFYDIEDIVKAPKLLEHLNLGVETSTIGFVKQLIYMKKFGLMIFIIVFVLVGLTAGLNIFLSFFQNIQSKVPEIGILRAIGSNKSLIFRCYLLESFFIWLASLIIGGLLAYNIGPYSGMYISQQYEIPGNVILFKMQWDLFFLVLVTTLLLCIFGTYFAVRRTIYSITPADAVRYKG